MSVCPDTHSRKEMERFRNSVLQREWMYRCQFYFAFVHTMSRYLNGICFRMRGLIQPYWQQMERIESNCSSSIHCSNKKWIWIRYSHTTNCTEIYCSTEGRFKRKTIVPIHEICISNLRYVQILTQWSIRMESNERIGKLCQGKKIVPSWRCYMHLDNQILTMNCIDREPEESDWKIRENYTKGSQSFQATNNPSKAPRTIQILTRNHSEMESQKFNEEVL